MRVSVIVPCYNAGAYLLPCLRSVLAQTMGDLELLVIDDGSTDGSLDAAQAVAREDARVRVLHQENRGVCAARNRGLDAAQGEYVTFVDGDDLLAPDALERMLAAAPGADMVVCAHETFDAQGKAQIVRPETRWMDRRGEARRRAAALRLIEGDSVLNIMCGKLHRRALLEREHLRLDEGVRIAEDALFNLEAVLCGEGVAFLDEPVYRYRMHGASATHTRARSEMEAHRPWLLAMRDMLARRGQLEAYYPAYVDSVVLRLNKDGGVPGVLRGFGREARPLLLGAALDSRRLSLRGRALLALARSGAYPAVYPLIFPVQLARRKLSAAACALREGRGKRR